MSMEAEQPGLEEQRADSDTTLVTMALTEDQLRVVAAIVKEKCWFMRSTDSLLAKEMLYQQTHPQQATVESLVQETQAAAAKLVDKITLEHYLLILTTTNVSEDDLDSLKQRLRQTFPDALKYYRPMEEDPRLANDLVFYVYVPVVAGKPDYESYV